MERKIFIKDWFLEASIGIHAHEKERRQRLRVNLTFSQNTDAPVHTIADVVDYDIHKTAIAALIASQHYDLLEALADDIAELCLATDTKITLVQVQLEKLDVYKDCVCGVVVEKKK